MPPTLLLIILSAEVVFHFILPLKIIIPPTYRYSGIILIILGIVLNIWADNLLKIHQTTIRPDEKPLYLISNGPFQFSRHPMYLGMFCILLGIAIILGSLIALIFSVIFVFVTNQKFICKEEKNMLHEFGRKYYDYQRKTRKWI